MTSPSLTEQQAPARGGIALFIVLCLAAIGLCALALYIGKAPLSGGFILSDWLDWMRIETTASGMLVMSAILFLTGIVGTLHRLTHPNTPRAKAPKPTKVKKTKPVKATPVLEAEPADAPLPTPSFAPQAPAPLSPAQAYRPPAPEPAMPRVVADNTRKASLKFDAAPAAPVNVPLGMGFGALPPAQADTPHVSAEIIPFRSEAPAENDPIAAALLADTPEPEPAASPESDIKAVVSSAISLIEAPDRAPNGVTSVAEVHAARHDPEPEAAPTFRALSEALSGNAEPVQAEPILAEPAAFEPETVESIADPRLEIETAVHNALQVWPEGTRPIAEGELTTRVSQLYYDSAIASREAFNLIKSGDLTTAAQRLKVQAAEWVGAGFPSKAADLWRIYGALHMGRDDEQAMHAYEQVSALDPADANIHLYLVRRYQMAGNTEPLLPVLVRALGAVSDMDTRGDLLTQYAELMQKAGDLPRTAQALEELSRIKAQQSANQPENLQLRSAQAIMLARLAQVREQLGDHPKAAPLYQDAHTIFAELSARVPDHAGLRAMAENALRDAQRLSAYN